MPALSRRAAMTALASSAMIWVPALASPQVNVLEGQGIAIHGFDPVAYFVEGAPRRGRADLSVVHDGGTWRFASEINRVRFLDDRQRYVPAFGGYCAHGVARGHLVRIDPDAWTVFYGRLYLNHDLAVRDAWLEDPGRFIAQARQHWPSLVHGAGPSGGSDR